MFCTARVFSFPFLPFFPTSSPQACLVPRPVPALPRVLAQFHPFDQASSPLAGLLAFLVNEFACGRSLGASVPPRSPQRIRP